MGHNALTCESASANSFTLLRHEKLPLWGERVRGFSFVSAQAEAGVFKENRFEIEIERYSQINQSGLRRLPINIFRGLKVTQSAHF